MDVAGDIRFDLLTPGQTLFGWGRRDELHRLLAGMRCRRVFAISGSRTLEADGIFASLFASLGAAGIEVTALGSIQREPETADVDTFTQQLLAYSVNSNDVVLGVGGGAAIDLAKAVAAMATNRQSPTVRDYLEGVGSGLQIENEPLPVVAMPTTAGTGSEATKNAVISSFDPPFKKSLRSTRMIPCIALVDPELTLALPPRMTAFTGMDAITQLIESYISRRATPITRALCVAGLPGVFEALRQAVGDGRSRWARQRMSQAALLSGMALTNSGLGIAHGVAAALGVHGPVPHGLACAVMLPVAIEVNRAACTGELAMLARIILGCKIHSDSTAIDVLLRELHGLCDEIGVPHTISELGLPREKLAALVCDSRGSSMSGNPIQLSDDELESVLKQHW